MSIALPAKAAELRGLRARRYVRVSSEEQGRKYGPEGQHDRIAAAITELGLVEAGAPFVDEQSAWARSDARPALRSLVAAAVAGELDVLIVAYFSRWSRDTEVALRIRRELHDAGVVLYFADEAFLSSDRDSHERFLDEAVGAEKFSHRLSRTITQTFAAKFERYGDQAGSPGLGFRRTAQPEARLEVDPATMPRVVGLFERYALGDVSYRELSHETGVAENAIRAVLTSTLYNGWAVRHRRSAHETRVPAPWRSDPPVSDELWARVCTVRIERLKNGGSPRTRRTYLLAKRLWCACGRSIAADSCQQRNGTVVRRYRHEDCPLGGQTTWQARHFEEPIAAQLSSIDLGPRLASRIRSIAGRSAPVDTSVRRRQLERELRTKATDHAARKITTKAYLAEHERLTVELDGLAVVATSSAPIDDADRVLGLLRDLRTTWRLAAADPEGIALQAKLIQQVYRRITVARGQIRSVELTDEAQALGLALALHPTVELARPAGTRDTRSTVARIAIPIEGRDEWLRLVRSA